MANTAVEAVQQRIIEELKGDLSRCHEKEIEREQQDQRAVKAGVDTINALRGNPFTDYEAMSEFCEALYDSGEHNKLSLPLQVKFMRWWSWYKKAALDTDE